MTLAALTVGGAGTVSNLVPGISPWPASTVCVFALVAIAVSVLFRKLLHVAVAALVLTVAAVIVDSLTGGHIQSALNLGGIAESWLG